MKGCKYGTHRVIEPVGVLPQPALKINNDMNIFDNEILIDVSALNIDSASFTQIEEAAGHDIEKIKEMILSIVAERGKMQNPVTGSGGMLIGTIEKIGSDLEGKIDLKVGDRIQIWGRVQSREYEKKREDGEPIKKVAYEVSISKIKKMSENNND